MMDEWAGYDGAAWTWLREHGDRDDYGRLAIGPEQPGWERFLAAVRAEAVAAEQQRISAEISTAIPPSARYMSRDAYNGMCDAYKDALVIVGEG